jgi:hypothetical protein
MSGVMLTRKEFDEAVKAIRCIVKPMDFRRGPGDKGDPAAWSDEHLAGAFSQLRPAELDAFLSRAPDLQVRRFLGRFGEVINAFMEFDGTDWNELFVVISAMPPGAGLDSLHEILARREREFDEETARRKERGEQHGKYVDAWLSSLPGETKPTDHLSFTQKVAGILATRPGTSAAAITEVLGIEKTKKNLNKIRAITSRLLQRAA